MPRRRPGTPNDLPVQMRSTSPVERPTPESVGDQLRAVFDDIQVEVARPAAERDMDRLGGSILRFMSTLGLRPAEFASLLGGGTSRGTVERWIRGEKVPQKRKIDRFRQISRMPNPLAGGLSVPNGEAASGEAGVPRGIEEYLAFVGEANRHLQGETRSEWLDRVTGEYNNIRRELERAPRTGQTDIALRLAVLLETYWNVQGMAGDGHEVLTRLMSRPAVGVTERSLIPALRLAGILASEIGDIAKAEEWYSRLRAVGEQAGNDEAVATGLNGMGNVCLNRGQYHEARDHYHNSLELRRRLGERQGEAATLCNLGIVAQRLEEFDEALRLYEQSLRIRTEIDDQPGIANVLSDIGYVETELGRYDEAEKRHLESLKIRSRLGRLSDTAASLLQLGITFHLRLHFLVATTLYDKALTYFEKVPNKRGMAMTLNQLGNAYQEQGLLDMAQLKHEQSLSIFRAVGDQWGTAAVVNNLGNDLGKKREYAAAWPLWKESIALKREMGAEPRIAGTLDSLVEAAAELRRWNDAAAFAGAAASLRSMIAQPSRETTLGEQQTQEDIVKQIRTELGEEAYARAFGKGKNLTLDDVIELAGRLF